ncbi:hypothetical protein MHH28_12780 [Paenibacillus sp. FSL K6-1217]
MFALNERPLTSNLPASFATLQLRSGPLLALEASGKTALAST